MNIVVSKLCPCTQIVIGELITSIIKWFIIEHKNILTKRETGTENVSPVKTPTSLHQHWGVLSCTQMQQTQKNKTKNNLSTLNKNMKYCFSNSLKFFKYFHGIIPSSISLVEAQKGINKVTFLSIHLSIYGEAITLPIAQWPRG